MMGNVGCHCNEGLSAAMTAHHSSLRIHCAASPQLPTNKCPGVAWTNLQKCCSATAELRQALSHETSKNTPVVLNTMMPCNDLMVLGDMLRCSCCHHVILTSSGTCRTSAPPHRLATHTLPGPLHSRRVAPSLATDSGHWTLDDGT